MKKSFTKEELEDYMKIIHMIDSQDRESIVLAFQLIKYDKFYNDFLKNKHSFLLGYQIDKLVDLTIKKKLYIPFVKNYSTYKAIYNTLRYPFKNFHKLDKPLFKYFANHPYFEDLFYGTFDLFKLTKFYRKRCRNIQDKHEICKIFVNLQPNQWV